MCIRDSFYNWYDTRTLLPLHPQYISSVDSGNLVGSLLALRAGLGELKNQPVLGDCAFDGLEDTLLALTAHTPSPAAPEIENQIRYVQSTLHSMNGGAEAPAAAQALLDRLYSATKELVAAPSVADVGELRYWARALNRQCRRFRDDLRSLMPEPERFGQLPTLEDLAEANSLPDEPGKP